MAPAEALPFEDEEFHCLVNTFLFHGLPKELQEMVATEFYRVMKPGPGQPCGSEVSDNLNIGPRVVNVQRTVSSAFKALPPSHQQLVHKGPFLSHFCSLGWRGHCIWLRLARQDSAFLRDTMADGQKSLFLQGPGVGLWECSRLLHCGCQQWAQAGAAVGASGFTVCAIF